MTSMIDTVAKAIHNSMARSAPGPTRHWETAPAEVKQFSRDLARAAIKAMREPTSYMICAMESDTRGSITIAEGWELLIDAALSEQADA